MAHSRRPRGDRRKLERELAKLGDAKEKLARISEGGSPERPIEVESASIVDARALSLGCARCDGELRLDESAATLGLRRVTGRCKSCGHVRIVWIRIAPRWLS